MAKLFRQSSSPLFGVSEDEKKKLSSQLKVGNASASEVFAFDKVDKDLMKASFAPQNIASDRMSILGSMGGVPNPEAVSASAALQINPGAVELGKNVPAIGKEVFNPSNMKEAGTFADALKGAEAMKAAEFTNLMGNISTYGAIASKILGMIGKGQDDPGFRPINRSLEEEQLPGVVGA